MINRCKIIQDLLPLYIDKLASDESHLLVSSHLDECETCNQIYKDMKKEPILSQKVEPSEIDLNKVISRIKKRRIISASSFLFFFSMLGILIGGYVFYANNVIINRVEPIPLTMKNRNIDENPAEYVNLESSFLKSYKINNKDFMPGFYDIKAVEGKIDIGGIHLDEGQEYAGKQFYSNNIISVRGNGYAQLTPSNFNKEKLKNETYSFHNKFGKFQAGGEIEAGKYTIQVINHFETPYHVFVSTSNFDENSSNGQSLDIKNSKIYTIAMKNEEFINISNWSEKKTDLTIKLTKLSNE